MGNKYDKMIDNSFNFADGELLSKMYEGGIGIDAPYVEDAPNLLLEKMPRKSRKTRKSLHHGEFRLRDKAKAGRRHGYTNHDNRADWNFFYGYEASYICKRAMPLPDKGEDAFDAFEVVASDAPTSHTEKFEANTLGNFFNADVKKYTKKLAEVEEKERAEIMESINRLLDEQKKILDELKNLYASISR